MTYIDRQRVLEEIRKNPALLSRLAEMTKGEVGLGGDLTKETIQAETALNRAMSRGITLDQSLRAVNEGKGGYYASDTYRGISPKQLDYFNTNIMPRLNAGSNVGGDTLGFVPTGNASLMSFAGRRAAEGKYGNYRWYGDKPGVGEMYVTEKPDMKWAGAQGGGIMPDATTLIASQQPTPPKVITDAGGTPIATAIPPGGMTLNSTPAQTPAAMPPATPTPAPTQTAAAEPSLASKFSTTLMGPEGKGGAGTLAGGLDEIASAFKRKPNPELNQLTPSAPSGHEGGNVNAAQAQALMAAILESKRRPMGLTLTGGLA